MKPAVVVTFIIGVIVFILCVVCVAWMLTQRQNLSQPSTLQHPSTRQTTDSKGKSVTVKDKQATVVTWHPDTGILDAKLDGKNHSYAIAPPATILLVPLGPNSKESFMIQKKNDRGWKTAFCPGDLVTISTSANNPNNVVFAYNVGSRTCAE